MNMCDIVYIKAYQSSFEQALVSAIFSALIGWKAWLQNKVQIFSNNAKIFTK
jgi:hypothetical protein